MENLRNYFQKQSKTRLVYWVPQDTQGLFIRVVGTVCQQGTRQEAHFISIELLRVTAEWWTGRTLNMVPEPFFLSQGSHWLDPLTRLSCRLWRGQAGTGEGAEHGHFASHSSGLGFCFETRSYSGLTPGHASVFQLAAVVSHCPVWSLP